MTLTQLQYIVALDTYRHFAKAADACHVTQPTLSMQIQKLEDELGVSLFDRNQHPVGITEVGRNIIDQAKIVLAESEKIQAITQEAMGRYEGEFRLGIIPTIAPSLLHRFLPKFRQKMPGIHLVIEELQTEQIIEKLKKDQLDAGIMATPLNERGLEEMPMYFEPFMAFIPSGHRLSNEDFITNSELDINDILLLSDGHCFRNSILNICKNTQAREEKMVRLESGNFDTLIKLAQLGYGMTLLPYLTAVDLSKELQHYIKPVADPKPSREVSLVYSSAQFKTSVVEKLFDIIHDSVPQKLLSNTGKIVGPTVD